MHSAAAQPYGLIWKFSASVRVALALAGFCADSTRAAESPCLEVSASTEDRPIVWNGRFETEDARGKKKISVCVHLSTPHRIRIAIDGPGLNTVGHVRFPDGHEEGAPGGPFFDQAVDAGDYDIIVEQRWPQWKMGPVRIALEVH